MSAQIIVLADYRAKRSDDALIKAAAQFWTDLLFWPWRACGCL